MNNKDVARDTLCVIVAFLCLVLLFIASFYFDIHLISECNIDTLC